MKPIKKQERELNQDLRRKKIYLDEDGWDILNLLKRGKEAADKKHRQKESDRVDKSKEMSQEIKLAKQKLKSDKDRCCSA